MTLCYNPRPDYYVMLCYIILYYIILYYIMLLHESLLCWYVMLGYAI